ncbi:MAG TPA: hypothetical protein PKY72_05315 [Bacilli bacterium]|nr:hypothetical protein [Bacilli bacterium]HQQ39698.1 hypothetical protein [Bacilli bacterium]
MTSTRQKNSVSAKSKKKVDKNSRKQKLDSEGLIYAEMCLDCEKKCKIKYIPGASLIRCPDFEEKK